MPERNDLQPPDEHHLSAAAGWLELGNRAEAKMELAKVSPAHSTHPEVLAVRWQIHAAEKEWPESLQIARQLIKADPGNPSGWINQSYSLHEMKRTQEAWEQLLPAAEKFPEISIIAYNLACYACRLGDLQKARPWLTRAIGIGGKEQIKRMAAKDSDLRELWPELEKI